MYCDCCWEWSKAPGGLGFLTLDLDSYPCIEGPDRLSPLLWYNILEADLACFTTDLTTNNRESTTDFVPLHPTEITFYSSSIARETINPSTVISSTEYSSVLHKSTNTIATPTIPLTLKSEADTSSVFPFTTTTKRKNTTNFMTQKTETSYPESVTTSKVPTFTPQTSNKTSTELPASKVTIAQTATDTTINTSSILKGTAYEQTTGTHSFISTTKAAISTISPGVHNPGISTSSGGKNSTTTYIYDYIYMFK